MPDELRPRTIAAFESHGDIVIVENGDGSIEIRQSYPGGTDFNVVTIPPYLISEFVAALSQK